MSCSLSHGTKISGSFPFLEVKEGIGIGAGVGNTVSNPASLAASISLIIFSASTRVYNGSSASAPLFSFLDLSDILTALQKLFNSSTVLCTLRVRVQTAESSTHSSTVLFQVEITADYNPL